VSPRSGIARPRLKAAVAQRISNCLPDAATLRRIALLVLRAGEDDVAVRHSMSEISRVIEHLKRDVALGVPLKRDKVARLGSLIDKATRGQSRTIHSAILAELRDLGHDLCRGIAD
jgi:hypothetical protein